MFDSLLSSKIWFPIVANREAILPRRSKTQMNDNRNFHNMYIQSLPIIPRTQTENYLLHQDRK